MTSTRPQAFANLPLFLVTLRRNRKSQEVFKLASLSHVIIKVEAYRAQTGLIKCYNYQKFGHVWGKTGNTHCILCSSGMRESANTTTRTTANTDPPKQCRKRG
jgi:hypothetical protein